MPLAVRFVSETVAVTVAAIPDVSEAPLAGDVIAIVMGESIVTMLVGDATTLPRLSYVRAVSS